MKTVTQREHLLKILRKILADARKDTTHKHAFYRVSISIHTLMAIIEELKKE